MKIYQQIVIVICITILGSCSNLLDLDVIYRGDIPLRFNKTKIELQESKETVLTLSLTTKPKANVTFEFDIEDASEAELDNTIYFFTPQNYNVAQQIKIRAKDDCIADGDQNTNFFLKSAKSDDSLYMIEKYTIPLKIKESSDNKPNLVVTKDSDIITSELGTTSFFQVKISCQPTADVAVPLVVSDTKEMEIDKNLLSFTKENYNVFQTITITGKNDCVQDTDKTVLISTKNVDTSDERFNRYHDTKPLIGGEERKTVSVSGVNKNENIQDQIVIAANGLAEMTIGSDDYASFAVSLSCPITTTSIIYIGFDLGTSGFSLLNPSNTPTFLHFNENTWSLSQNLLLNRNGTSIGEKTIIIRQVDNSALPLTSPTYSAVPLTIEVK